MVRSIAALLIASMVYAPPTQGAPPEGCEDERQAAMLRAINTVRSEARRCGDRDFAAVPPLRWHCRLEATARDHSDDMARHDFIGHESSDGQKLYERVRGHGYAPRAWGENLAAGQQYLVEAIAGWLESPHHCSNLMQSKFTEVGIARSEGAVSEYRWFWTMVFATPDR